LISRKLAAPAPPRSIVVAPGDHYRARDPRPVDPQTMTSYRSVHVDGLEIFYREAGHPSSPKLLLLHGFPASSHQYRELLARLDDRFHMVSVDYPGFGLSSMPDPAEWEYTFDRIADVVDGALQQIGFTGPMGMYVQDYGGPIGNRLTAEHPEWLRWQVIQNANSYEEGFTEVWDGLRHALWQNRSPETEAPLQAFLERPTVREIYVHGHPDVTKISPDTWETDLHFLARPNAHRVQLDLLYDYRKNAELYETWQQTLRQTQPPTVIFWGQGDLFFTPEGGEAYLRDLPDAELHRLDSGHFCLEDHLEEIAEGIVAFYDQKVAPSVAGRV
jgi:pimeloyl-ACP methyl ester carboxylesterase